MSPQPNNRNYLLLRAYQAGLDDPKELAAFMGQMEVESRDFRSLEENLNYRGERLLEMFKGRNGLNTLEQANAIAVAGPVAVANAIYGGEWGRTGTSGNTEPGDGWRFHGRGYIQLTGRYNYTRDGHELGLDLVDNPDLAADRSIAADIAIHYWQSRVVPRGHQLDVRAATRDINGGYNHLPERMAAVARWERRLTPEVMERLSHEAPRVRPGHMHDHGRGDQPSGHAPSGPGDPIRRQEYEGRVMPFSPVAPISGAPQRSPASGSPTEAGHPHHNLLLQIRAGVAAIDERAGKPYDESSERVSRSLLVACRTFPREPNAGASADGYAIRRVDHVFLTADGSRAFAIEGDLRDPSHRRANVEMARAVRTPVEDADRALTALERHATARDVNLSMPRDRSERETLDHQAHAPGRLSIG